MQSPKVKHKKRVASPSQVDIVYLWVDGSDPVWRGRRNAAFTQWYLQYPHDLAAFGNAAGRYRDNDELLFNLRALERFFPDHGHVYLVTDGQTPAWLQPSDSLTVIDHRDLFPQSTPWVFDSGHIESYLHHIEGLSERFIYMNDDVFFGATVDIDWWFGDRLRVFSELVRVPDYDALQKGESALVNASLLSRDWLSQRYPHYQHDPRVYSHSPRPMLKSAMVELERIAAELFTLVRSTAFRSWKVPPIVPDLVPRWMVHVGYADQSTLDPLYISTGDDRAEEQLKTLLSEFGQLPFFCINDTCDEAFEDDIRLTRIAQTLQQLLPQPSSFELASPL